MSRQMSLVLACYNEAEHFEESIKEILETLRNCHYSFEIILIDDKSKDNTRDLIEKAAKDNKEIRAYFHKVNKGRGITVKEGILKAKSAIVGFIDIDLEVAPDYIPKFVRIILENKADVVIGHRFYPFHLLPFDYLLREIGSRVYVMLVKILLGLPFEDTEAGYKFFNKAKIMPVLSKTENPHWFWDTEIVARSYYHGLGIKDLPVLFLRREDKTSTVRLIPDVIAYFKSIISFKKTLKREYSPPPGILYSFPKFYPLAIKFLFGASYKDRYKKIAKLIPQNSSVADVCCGDATLATYLKDVDYLGIDISLKFVIFNNKRGVATRLLDVEKEDIPSSDYVVLQGSLYQFKSPSKIVDKLYKSAKKYLIISESVNNLKVNPLFANTLAKRIVSLFADSNNPDPYFRFDEESFKNLLKKYKPEYKNIRGGRDLIAIIRKGV